MIDPRLNKSPHAKQKESLNTSDQASGLRPREVAARIAGLYVLLGSVWIVFSDKFFGSVISDTDMLTAINMVKGWVYVLVTGLLLYRLIYPVLNRMSVAHKQIEESYQELAVTNHELDAKEHELRAQLELLEANKARLQRSEERYRLVTEATNDGIWDEMGEQRYFSDRWYEITGYTKADIKKMGDWRKIIHPKDVPRVKETFAAHCQERKPVYACEYRILIKSGEYRWIRARARLLYNEDGSLARMAGSHTDVTELKHYQEELEHLAYHDSLTGLPNRLALAEDVKAQTTTNPKRKGTILFIDIDNFKNINDCMGHSAGDQLLCQFSDRLGQIRADCTEIYRFGGDEFVIVRWGDYKPSELEEYIGQLQELCEQPIAFGDSMLHITFSIGVALYPEHGEDSDPLLRRADLAMYAAKERGRNGYCIFNESMNQNMAEKVLMEKQLRTALENQELAVYYQPQWDMTRECITGFEALIRWNNPILGDVPADRTIEAAEATLLIIPIGDWVLRNACGFIKSLHQKGYTDLKIAVNISLLQLFREDFVERILQVLQSVDLSPKYLELELTESVLAEHYEVLADKLDHLREKGIGIALDDFGQGYSSLGRLEKLPINTLKIDKSFVDNIVENERSATLLGQVVAIGRNMGMLVVAEGVETKEQLACLQNKDCHLMQGFLLGKPESEDQALLRLSQAKN